MRNELYFLGIGILSLILIIVTYILIALIISRYEQTTPGFFFGQYDCVHDENITLNHIQRIWINCSNCTNRIIFSNNNIYYLLCLLYQCCRVMPCTKMKTYLGDLTDERTIFSEKIPFFVGKFPIARFCYDSQTKTTIVIAASAKTIYLYLMAFFSGLKSIPWSKRGGKYHAGIVKIYEPVLGEILNCWQRHYEKKSNQVIFLGQSLGGAGAIYLSYYIATHTNYNPNNIFVLRAGSIRCGDLSFASDYSDVIPYENTLHLHNIDDKECLVPPSHYISPFEALGKTIYVTMPASSIHRPHSLETYIEIYKKKLQTNKD